MGVTRVCTNYHIFLDWVLYMIVQAHILQGDFLICFSGGPLLLGEVNGNQHYFKHLTRIYVLGWLHEWVCAGAH